MSLSKLEQEELEERQMEDAILEEEFKEDHADQSQESEKRKPWKIILEWAIYITWNQKNTHNNNGYVNCPL